MKKKILVGFIIIGMITLITGCASWDRFVVDMKSDVGNGLERTINIYTADGELMQTYSGKIDLEMSEGGYVKFDFRRIRNSGIWQSLRLFISGMFGWRKNRN